MPKSSTKSSPLPNAKVAAGLPWNFEAFRRYLNFEVLQQAAGVLCLFDGTALLSDVHLMTEFTRLLQQRTGLDWVPARQASEGVLFNVEGDIFRNKARVFTSLFIVDPRSFASGGCIVVTPFGRALGTGRIERKQFYGEIIKRFRYPHPAYDDNWNAWTAAGVSTQPLAVILKLLVELFRKGDQLGVTTGELATHLHPQPFFQLIPDIADDIIKSRSTSSQVSRSRTDNVDRKLSDILGFLCISRFAFYDKSRVRLNLLGVHRDERTAFWLQREGQNRLVEIELLLEESLTYDK